eukprot:jgi/Chrzof1/1160/Cz01g42230.t1
MAEEQMTMEEEVLDYEGDADAPVMEEAQAADTTDDPAADMQADANGSAATTHEAGADTEATDAQPMDASVPEAGGAVVADKPHDESQPDAGPADLNDPMKQPPHGTEVFMANIAHDATDDQIKEFAQQLGEVFSMRVPKHQSGQNKGFAFIVYKTTAEADSAIEHLNTQELKDFPGRKVKVTTSQVKNRLFIGNVPKAMKAEEISDVLKKAVVGVQEVDLMMDKEVPGQNRGFGFIGFYNYACAEAARKKLGDSEFIIGGRPVTITWAEPRREDDQQKVKSIYVGNLPPTVTDTKLRDIFGAYGEIEKVMLPPSKDDPTKFRDYGFVHYTERASALKAVTQAEVDKPTVDGKEVHVAMAKPPSDYSQAGGQGGGAGYGQTRGYGGQYGQQGGGYNRGYGQQGGRGGAGRGGYSQGTTGGYSGRGGGQRQGRGYGSGGYRSYDNYDGDYGEGYDDYGDEGYSGGGGGYATAGYGAAAYAAGNPGMTMVPMMLANGQMGYMLSGVAAGAGGPVRRAASATGAYSTGYGAAARGTSSSYGGSSGYGASGYGAAARGGGSAYGAGTGSSRGGAGGAYGGRAGASGRTGYGASGRGGGSGYRPY